jgi:proline iminopeptidase
VREMLAEALERRLGLCACNPGRMDGQYPPIEPYEQGMLDVGDGQQVYWETVGNPDGLPALFVHGGPGSGSSAGQRRFFDPAGYRGVLFDQRGCGRSRPLVSDFDVDLSVNTTLHLIRDMERLRGQLRIDRWLLFGLSWGSTLAIAYAQRFPEHVAGIVLGAVTAGTRREIDWICREMGRVFPREWERLIALVPEVEIHGSIPGAYAQLLADPDPLVRADAAEAWRTWEDAHISLVPGYRPSPDGHQPQRQMVFARLVTHYWSNDCFLGEDEIFRNMDRVIGIPAVLVHGRYDVSSPLDTAWRLHRAWPRSRLVVVEDAGHGGGSFGSALIDALESFKRPSR